MLPTISIGPLQVSRLIVGGNPFSGISHQTPDRDRAMADFYTAARLKATLRDCETHGITTAVLRADAHIWWLLSEYWAEGGHIQWIAQTAPEYCDPQRNIDQALAHGACAVYLHGGEVDGWVTSGQTDRVFTLIEYIHSAGVPAGVAAHSPEVHLELHRLGLPTDFHMVCWYNCGSVHGGQGDLFDPADPPRAAAALQAIDKPCLAYKVLAAGRRPPAEAFPEVCAALKPTDAIVVGLFTPDAPDMIAENAELAQSLLHPSLIRGTRPCHYRGPALSLTDLAAELVDHWRSPEQERRRRLWADHFEGRTRQIPVSCAMFQGAQDLVWQQILPEDAFTYKEGLARHLEYHLRHRLWRIAHIPDDTPLDPTLTLWAVPPLAADELWGVPVEFTHASEPGGAYKPRPPLADDPDLSRLRAPQFRCDRATMARQEAEVRDLIGDALPIAFHADALHNGPFEWAVRLRGMDALLLDCYDRPAWLHELMAFLSASMVAYHRAREAAGFVSSRTENALHAPWDVRSDPAPALAPAAESPRSDLAGAWGYLHAQSAASYGPDTYAEFVHPYNVPIAELFGKVYYHGCEDLTRKVMTLRELPNLRQFHVSPWSQVAPIAAALPAHVVMEVHSHPTNVLFLWGESEMREELRGLVGDAGEHLFNLKLCDIQTLNADAGEALRTWSSVAKEAATEAR